MDWLTQNRIWSALEAAFDTKRIFLLSATAGMNCPTGPWCFSVNPDHYIRRVSDAVAAGVAGWTTASICLLKENSCSSTF